MVAGECLTLLARVGHLKTLRPPDTQQQGTIGSIRTSVFVRLCCLRWASITCHGSSLLDARA
jgi:hypothetical protein